MFADVKLTIRSDGDGPAVVNLTTADGDGEDELLDAVVEALALRRPEPAAALVVPVATVLEILAGAGYDESAHVFVSVCAPATAGRASGPGVDLVHFDSCAVWESRHAEADGAEARLRFEPRTAPWVPDAIAAGVLVVLALTTAVLAASRPAGAGRRLARFVGLATIAVALVHAAVLVFEADASDPSFATGQSFDEDIARSYLTIARTLTIAAAAAPILLYTACTWHRRRRRDRQAREP